MSPVLRALVFFNFEHLGALCFRPLSRTELSPAPN